MDSNLLIRTQRTEYKFTLSHGLRRDGGSRPTLYLLNPFSVATIRTGPCLPLPPPRSPSSSFHEAITTFYLFQMTAQLIALTKSVRWASASVPRGLPRPNLEMKWNSVLRHAHPHTEKSDGNFRFRECSPVAIESFPQSSEIQPERLIFTACVCAFKDLNISALNSTSKVSFISVSKRDENSLRILYISVTDWLTN